MAEPAAWGVGEGSGCRWGGESLQLSPMLLSLSFLTWVDQSRVKLPGSQILVSPPSAFADKS